MPDPNAFPSAEDLNPYAAPRLVPDAPLPEAELLVDGNCLVVGSRVILPQRCIFTNEAVWPGDRIRRRLDWAPTFRLVLRHRHCYVSYYVNRRHRHRQYLTRTLLGLLAMAVTWLLLGIASLWVLCLIPVAVVAVPRDGMRVVAYRDGRFWITGFGDAFLHSCAQEFGTTPSPSAKPPH